jgi:hypothetical protein
MGAREHGPRGVVLYRALHSRRALPSCGILPAPAFSRRHLVSRLPPSLVLRIRARAFLAAPNSLLILARHNTSHRKRTWDAPPLGRRMCPNDPALVIFSEADIMKTLLQTLAVAAALALPMACFAQSDDAVTRADVRAQLVQLEHDGYHPASGRADYPAGIQAAEARASAHDGYGGAADTSSESGFAYSPKYDPGLVSIYGHH